MQILTKIIKLEQFLKSLKAELQCVIWIGVRNTKQFKELIALVGHLALIRQSKLE
ncbi:hypothetical protein VCR31J2_1380107 [Vibrio coralliirubri]|uniref:Uncharacterized protein n=1 Tax=Vibrio coralliirubri TaxID=1516159 RepID=A0AA86WQL9_9VIBR|nr:hypothetical protein VCR31J2_1380107 [Vibrio coralliirubri]